MSRAVKCPLCGKQTPERSYHPENYEDDVFVVEVIGLGYGKGFSNSEERSAFEDPNCSELQNSLAERALRIVGFLVERGQLSADQVVSEIGLEEPLDDITEEIAGALGEDNWREEWDTDRLDVDDNSKSGSVIVDLLMHGARRLIENCGQQEAPDSDRG
ncbi:MAG: hypothetical protein OK457_08485 [Thaumarchaeota archaeon]|nr:hypothetical protein [Nitrososphaerota archaeon]